MSGRLEEYGIDPNTNERLKVIREIEHHHGDKIVFHVNSTGKRHGTYRRFILNNFLVEEIMYKDGQMHGHVHTFHNNGKPMVKTNFLNGKEHGHRQEWYPDGTLKYTCFYSHGIFDGEMINYYLNGKIMLKCAYIEGQLCGLYQIWNSDGTLIEEKNYSRI